MSEAQLAALEDVTRLFHVEGLEYWLFGGWAVDFHAGRVTRPHGDLDFLVRVADRERALRLLAEDGWTAVVYAHPQEGARLERDGQRDELTYVASAEDGQVYNPGRAADLRLPDPAHGMTPMTLEGVTCAVLALELMIALKSASLDLDRKLDERDAHDLALLLATASPD
jgi:hypothetical protein